MQIVSYVNISDVVDIAIVAYIFYNLFMFIKDTRAEQVFKGLVFLLVITKISQILTFHVLYWILSNALTMGFVAVFIIFQPELRGGLEKLGRSKFNFLGKVSSNVLDKELDIVVNSLADALFELSKDKIGALIIIERHTGLGEIIKTGIKIDGEISRQLLMNIFTPNTPLHDGAVVVRGSKIKSASCFLPLTEQLNLSSDLGTRHRAGIGVTEVSDCLSLIVSEETGSVSIAKEGKLKKDLTKEDLLSMLVEELKEKEEEKTILRGGYLK